MYDPKKHIAITDELIFKLVDQHLEISKGITSEEAWGMINARTATRTFSLKPYLKYAAILVIGILGYVIILSGDVKLKAVSHTRNIALPDHSFVMVRPGSSIEYNTVLWRLSRNVNLQGTAKFIVSKGSQFDVHSTHGTVSVLGTIFSVKDQDTTYTVKCYEGKVQVQTAANSHVLTPGFKLHSSQQGATVSKTLQKSTNFEKAELGIVFAFVEQYYGIEIMNKEKVKARFTGSIPLDNLDLALRIVCGPMGLSFEKIDNNKIQIVSNQK